MIAAVRGVIAASSFRASIWNVSGSVSTKTGSAYCAQHGVDGRDERVRRHDDFVARLDRPWRSGW